MVRVLDLGKYDFWILEKACHWQAVTFSKEQEPPKAEDTIRTVSGYPE